jgi:hypothetical protein
MRYRDSGDVPVPPGDETFKIEAAVNVPINKFS